jgi:mannose-6-phosphate isomerase
MEPDLYPLKFVPIYQPKVWGGRRLEMLGRALPGDGGHAIGESWELVDLGATDTTSASHAPARSVICNGPLKGKSIHDAMLLYGERLMGRVAPGPAGEFPLLIKFLDARENLSIQVHPSQSYAAAHPESHLKSEAWYIVEAVAGATIFKGLRKGVSPPQLRAAIESRDEAAIIDTLVRVPVKPGDCHYIPSGTVHALGAGIVVAEVQLTSDTTFRLYDWGRSRMTADEQRLHIEHAMRCISYDATPATRYEKRSHVAGFFTTVTSLVRCEHFHIEKVRMTEGYEQDIPYDQPAIWIVLQGEGRITRKASEPVPFSRGDTLLVPANMNDARVVLTKDTIWLEVTFPAAMQPLD